MRYFNKFVFIKYVLCQQWIYKFSKSAIFTERNNAVYFLHFQSDFQDNKP